MIEQIELKNFRNLENYSIKLQKPLVIIEGLNGVGKTSILEAIYFTATTKSHRTSQEKDIIQYQKEFAFVKLKQNQQIHEIVLTPNGKRTWINKHEIRKISDYIGKFHVVMFSPEDLMLIKGGPSERRYFMDMELMQVSKEYLRALNTYKKILKQRNLLLKKISIDDDFTFLNIISEQLYQVGCVIYDEREKFIQQLNLKLSHLKTTYQLDISLHYEPHMNKDQWLKYLKTKQKQDILHQTSYAGIHKDDFKVLYNGLNAKDNASQGTIRLIVIELKLALLEWIKEHTQQDAVLLLDDVLSELDLERQKIFLEKLSKKHQIIISSALHIESSADLQKIVLTKEKDVYAK